VRSCCKSFLATTTALLLVLAPAFSQTALADARQPVTQQHVVSPADLQKDVAAAARARQANQAAVENFFASSRARQSLKKAGMDYRVVKQGVSLLSNDELASLAARAQRAQKQFAAGALTNQEITYIIIALATAVIILIIVER
jgi:hypothetical protein